MNIMGCNSDYMDSSLSEKNLSKVYGLLDELETGVLPSDFGTGYDSRAYNKASKSHLDEKTNELCEKIQNVNINEFSLEMQLWWREHQLADKSRVEEEMKNKKSEKDRKEALLKLSKYERSLLGLD